MVRVRCLICQKEISAKPSHLEKGRGKYCSVLCRTKSQFTGRKVTCFICKKEIYRSVKELKKSNSRNYFCSKTCQTTGVISFCFQEKIIVTGKMERHLT